MPETLNVNVLVTAKEEYTKQLVFSLTPLVLNSVNTIFTESQKLNKRRKLSYRNFQILLKQVPGWSSYQLDSELIKVKESCGFLMDLVTAIFVSHVKILACVRLKGDYKRIRIKIPTMESFIHKILIQTCEKIYYTPGIIHGKKEELSSIIEITIEDSIRKQIPIESILTEYLSGVFDDNDEEETSLPADKIVSDDEYDESDESSDDEDEDPQKHIPIIPIERPISKDNNISHVVKRDDPEEELDEEETDEEPVLEEPEPEEEEPEEEPDEPDTKTDTKEKITLFNDI